MRRNSSSNIKPLWKQPLDKWVKWKDCCIKKQHHDHLFCWNILVSINAKNCESELCLYIKHIKILFNVVQIKLGSCSKSTRAFHSICQPNRKFSILMNIMYLELNFYALQCWFAENECSSGIQDHNNILIESMLSVRSTNCNTVELW